jgi:type II restriction enzyme
MHVQLPIGDSSLALGYASASQRARVVTEAWIKHHGYCLACKGDQLVPTSANTQARDFECKHCRHAYELKSAASPFGKRVTDGAYASMMRRISTSTTPSFLLLQYTATWNVTNLWAIHHALITPSAIEQRKALAVTAKRAGWVGCNILLSGIPPEGRIPLVVNGFAIPKSESRRRFAASEGLSHLSPLGRGWAASTLRLLHKMDKPRFTIEEAYSLEAELSLLYPSNKNVRPKIRQQLQVLRDAGIIRFESRGNYRFTDPI